MSQLRPIPALFLITVVLGLSSSSGSRAQTPGTSVNQVLAVVNGELVTLDDLLDNVRSMHGGVEQSSTTFKDSDPMAVLERVVDLTLIAQEARTIGLDELSQVTRRVAASRMDLLRKYLAKEYVSNLTTGDPEDVDRLYRLAATEFMVESTLFPSSEEAQAFEQAVQGGADFATLSRELVHDGKAMTSPQGGFLPAGSLFPEVVQVLLDLEAGQVSSSIEVPGGHTVVKLLDMRTPENPEARAQAEKQALDLKKQQALLGYTDDLRQRYSVVDRELMDSLEFNSRPDAIEKYGDDQRVVAEIKGGDDITLADLTARVEKKYFHGVEGAIERNRVNSELWGILDRAILEQAAVLEAARLGIEEDPMFQDRMRMMENGLLFNTFLSRVIDPDIALNDDDLRAFYGQHILEYTSPEVMRVESLAFNQQGDAEAALEKLRQGADIGWMKTNASGRAVPVPGDETLLSLRGAPISVAGLPADVRKALAGATTGDLRLFEDEHGRFYVFYILEARPPVPQPFEAVEEQIANRLIGMERQRRLDEWIGRLRQASEIETQVDRDQLNQALGISSGEDA